MPSNSHAAAAICLALVGAPSQVRAQPPSDIQVTAIFEADGARAGATYQAAVDAKLDAGFHVNSNEPLDEGLIATSLTIDPPDGIVLGAVAWPESFMFTVGQDELAVFGETFVIGIALNLAKDLAVGQHVVTGTLLYQACNDTMCFFPKTAPLSFPINVVDEAQPVVPTHTDVFEGLSFAPIADPGSASADPRATPSASDDAEVMTRLASFELLGTTGGYLGTDDFLDFIDRAESGRAEEGWFAGRGPLAILLLILVGGLALNLTPCVLPMIPINLAIIGAGAKAGSRTRGFALGSAYGLAMALVYGVLGLVVILTAGTFGTINASPWFNLGIATLFVVLGLAMFDVLTIDFSSLQNKFNIGGSAGGGSFSPRIWNGRRGSTARRGLCCTGGHSSHRVLEQSLRHGHGHRAAAAVRSRDRNGPALADRRGRPDPHAKTWRLDGQGQAGVWGVHSGDGGVLRLSVVRTLQPAMGRPRGGGDERARAPRRRLVCVARSRTSDCGGGRQAGARRRLGHVV